MLNSFGQLLSSLGFNLLQPTTDLRTSIQAGGFAQARPLAQVWQRKRLLLDYFYTLWNK